MLPAKRAKVLVLALPSPASAGQWPRVGSRTIQQAAEALDKLRPNQLNRRVNEALTRNVKCLWHESGNLFHGFRFLSILFECSFDTMNLVYFDVACCRRLPPRGAKTTPLSLPSCSWLPRRLNPAERAGSIFARPFLSARLYGARYTTCEILFSMAEFIL